MIKKGKVNWYRLNRNLHRDLGYFAIMLTVIFGVSGIALNHIADWNSNYIVERIEQPIALSANDEEQEINRQALEQLFIADPVKASYWETSQHYKLFFDGGGSLTIDFSTQLAVYEKITERPVLKQFNSLHLNEVKHGWVILSDIYAGILIFLAISALFMVKGKYSPWRLRKGWLVILGFVLPCVYAFL